MKILGISGSPRPCSNSRILLDSAMKPFQKENWDIEIIDLCKTEIKPCNGCESCLTTNECVITDDMHHIYKQFFECDAMIVSSPVYNRNISSKLTACSLLNFGSSITSCELIIPGLLIYFSY